MLVRINTKILERKKSGTQGDHVCCYLNTLTQRASAFAGSQRLATVWCAVRGGDIFSASLPCCGRRFNVTVANPGAATGIPSGQPPFLSFFTAQCSQLWFWMVAGHSFFRRESSSDIFLTSCKHNNPKGKSLLRSGCSGVNGDKQQNIYYVIVLKIDSLQEVKEYFEHYRHFAFGKLRQIDLMAGQRQCPDWTSRPSCPANPCDVTLPLLNGL